MTLVRQGAAAETFCFRNINIRAIEPKK